MKRLVETNRWRDQYFMDLSPYAKLMLSFLYDNCDDVGAIDVHYALFEVQLKMNRQQIKESISELQQMLLSDKKSKLFIKDYLKHQQKLPIKKGTTEGDWIISKLESNLQRFNNASEIQEILNNIEEEKKLEPVKKKSVKKKEHSPEFTPPKVEEFIQYFEENGFDEELAKRAWNSYNSNDWKDSKDTPVKNWRQKCQNNWFRPENKKTEKTEKKSKLQTTMSVVEEMTRNPNN